MTVTGDKFLRGLKRRITIPANQVLIDNPGMLELCDDVMRDKMVPLLLSVNENYFVVEETEVEVANQAAYSIPYRSIGRTLRDLKMRQVGATNSIQDMSLIALEDAHMMAPSGVPSGFYFRGDKIVLVPYPISDQYELIKYYDLQPSRLVQTTSAALIQSVSTNVVTCATVPPSFASGVYVDFVKGIQGCSTLAMDVQITNVSGSQVTFTSASDIPSDLVAGDYIALAQETPVLQIPDEAVPLLETLTGERVLYAISDYEGAEKLLSDAARQEKDLLKVISPRVQGEQTKIVNRRGLLRGQGFNSWRVRGGFYS